MAECAEAHEDSAPSIEQPQGQTEMAEIFSADIGMASCMPESLAAIIPFNEPQNNSPRKGLFFWPGSSQAELSDNDADLLGERCTTPPPDVRTPPQSPTDSPIASPSQYFSKSLTQPGSPFVGHAPRTLHESPSPQQPWRSPSRPIPSRGFVAIQLFNSDGDTDREAPGPRSLVGDGATVWANGGSPGASQLAIGDSWGQSPPPHPSSGSPTDQMSGRASSISPLRPMAFRAASGGVGALRPLRLLQGNHKAPTLECIRAGLDSTNLSAGPPGGTTNAPITNLSEIGIIDASQIGGEEGLIATEYQHKWGPELSLDRGAVSGRRRSISPIRESEWENRHTVSPAGGRSFIHSARKRRTPSPLSWGAGLVEQGEEALEVVESFLQGPTPSPPLFSNRRAGSEEETVKRTGDPKGSFVMRRLIMKPGEERERVGPGKGQGLAGVGNASKEVAEAGEREGEKEIDRQRSHSVSQASASHTTNSNSAGYDGSEGSVLGLTSAAEMGEPQSKRQRGSYKCRRCGQPKRGHNCAPDAHTLQARSKLSFGAAIQTFSAPSSQQVPVEAPASGVVASPLGGDGFVYGTGRQVISPNLYPRSHGEDVHGSRRLSFSGRGDSGKGHPPANPPTPFSMEGVLDQGLSPPGRGLLVPKVEYQPSCMPPPFAVPAARGGENARSPITHRLVLSSSARHGANLRTTDVDDCMVRIFSKLPPKDLLACSMCCRRWLSLANKIWDNIEEARLVATENKPPLEYVAFMLHRCQNLVRITLKADRPVGDSVLNKISQERPTLKSLVIAMFPGISCDVTGDGLLALVQACQKLEVLQIDGCSRLMGLSLSSKSLCHLSLSACDRLSHAILNCPALEELSISLLPLGTLATVNGVIPPPPLSPAAAGIAKEGLCGVAPMETNDNPNNRTSQLLRQISLLSAPLARLHVSSPHISDGGLTGLLSGEWKSLTSLSLTLAPNISNDGVKEIAHKCTALRFLDLSGCASITNMSLHHISRVLGRTLTRLLVAACPGLTLGGIEAALTKLPNLQMLDCGHSLVAPVDRPPPQGSDEGGGGSERDVVLLGRGETQSGKSGKSRSAGGDGPRRNARCHIGGGRVRNAKGNGMDVDIAFTEVGKTVGVLRVNSKNLSQLSLWGCTAIQGLVLCCPSLRELNLNHCTGLGEELYLDCPALEKLHSLGCSQSILQRLYGN